MTDRQNKKDTIKISAMKGK